MPVKTNGSELRAYGIRVLTLKHPQIRKLRRKVEPTEYGERVWGSSYLLMDYLSRGNLKGGERILEIGCGWGLAGIHCARRHGARVTAVDADDNVFPFLRLAAKLNKVDVATQRSRYEHLRRKHLEGFDVLIGADVCFWHAQTDPLKLLIRRALKAGVKTVLIADPGRPPYHKVSSHFTGKNGGKELEWRIEKPYTVHGYILRVDGPNGSR